MWSDTKIASILAHLNLQTSSVSCRSSADSWALSAPLKSNTSTYWCADSSGQSGQGSINATTGLCDVSISGGTGGTSGYTGDTFSSGGLTWMGADAPGDGMSWDDGNAYCTGLGWRLPATDEYAQAQSIGNFEGGYWASGLYNTDKAWGWLGNYGSDVDLKTYNRKIRCVK